MGELTGRDGWPTALVVALALALLLALLYWPATRYDFVAYDDDHYISENPLLAGGLTWHNAGAAFTTPQMGLWLPLVAISYMVDQTVFGPAPGGFHLTNVLLFSLDMALLLLLLWRMTGALAPSAVAAAFVAFHPLRVESVAWAAERKDVLALLFALLALAAWLRYVRSGKKRWYLATAVAFSLGLMAKPILVTLPLLLLLLDHWPLGRLAGDGSPFPRLRLLVIEKLPFFLLSALFCVITIKMQGESIHPTPLIERLTLAFSSPLVYLRKTVWPNDLHLEFFRPDLTPAWWAGAAAAMALAAITWLALRHSRTRPFLLTGWLWFLVALLPVSGIVPTGTQWLSDRFTLLPSIGIALALAWAGADALRGATFPWRRVALALTGLLLLASALLTRMQLPVWRNSATLLSRSLEYAPDHAILYTNLGKYLAETRDPERKQEAFRLLREVESRHPDSTPAHYHLGGLYLERKDWGAAIDEFTRVLQGGQAPPNARAYAYAQMGVALAGLQRPKEAIDHYRQALAILPTLEEARFNLAGALAREGRHDEAVVEYREVIRNSPGDLEARMGLVRSLLAAGRIVEGDGEAAEIGRLFPGTAEELMAKGLLEKARGRPIRPPPSFDPS
jgi:protein O-mannosyl-transferase